MIVIRLIIIAIIYFNFIIKVNLLTVIFIHPFMKVSLIAYQLSHYLTV